jgi:hypothetical protein
MQRKPPNRIKRAGTILVLSAALMVVMFGMIAFAVDIGYISVISTELQRAADSAAASAANQLLDGISDSGTPDEYSYSAYQARTVATTYAASNRVGGSTSALFWGDVNIGYLSDPSDRNCAMDYSDPAKYNAVRVLIRRTAAMNGETPLFFARALGITSAADQREATAAFLNGFSGFEMPRDGTNLGMMPFAMDEDTWNGMLAGTTGTDNFSWDRNSETVTSGGDGVLELNLYPGQDTTLPAGNRGTLDIGSDSNSTADIARQVLYGANEADLAFHGGSLELNDSGELILNGDTGISAGIKEELASIIGQPRIIPLFRTVVGNGNNAMYTIVGFAGVTVLEVHLTGNTTNKRVMIQPAKVVTGGGISDGGAGATTTYGIYSTAWLVR